MEEVLKKKIKIYIEGLGEQINLIIDNRVSDKGLKDELQKGVKMEVENTWRNLELLIDEEG